MDKMVDQHAVDVKSLFSIGKYTFDTLWMEEVVLGFFAFFFFSNTS